MRFTLAALFISLTMLSHVNAQSAQAKYGNDFLSTGGGARALGMGSAQAAAANDVTAAYWNVAGLAGIKSPQAIYMHSERFSGIVGYDYGAFALPLKDRNSVLSLSFFRQGVDNIANTLNAWDHDRNQPRENAEAFITRFSAADMALFLFTSSNDFNRYLIDSLHPHNNGNDYWETPKLF